MHIDDPERRTWLRDRMEKTQNHIHLKRDEQLRILTRLTDAVIFEEFIQQKYPGAKTFSLEGAESLIPLLDLAIETAGAHELDEIVLAMAHRGRLNVLANIVGKRPRESARTRRSFSGETMLMRVGSVQAGTAGRPGSVQVRSAAKSRPLVSIDTDPAPCVFSTKTDSLSFLSSLLTRLGCSCVNSSPPSGAPTMPSALSVPAHASVHVAPAAITPGIAVIVTSRSGGCCWAAATARRRTHRAMAQATVLFMRRL